MALKSVLKSLFCFISHFPRKQNPNTVDIFAWLPTELLIYHILLKLPVKTLLRLKSVSKSWLSLISSREFIEIHLAKSTNDPRFTHCHLLVSFVPFAPYGEPENVHGLLKSFTSLSLYSLINELVTEPIEHDYLGDNFRYVVGHCKGLVCVVGKDHVLLCNPSTRISRRLPKLEHKLCKFGFGYSELTNEFKVVAISTCTYAGETGVVLIHSSKIDSWKMIGNFPLKDVPDCDGIFTDGAIHWTVRTPRRFNYPKSFVIVSLDLKTETYREILPPDCGKHLRCCNLGTLGKNLSLCEFDDANDHAKLWIMKKRDVQQEWTQLVTIPFTNLDRLRQLFLKPTQIFVDGDIIVNSETNLRLYNAKGNTYRELLDTERGWLRDVHSYVESLVSPFL